MIKRNLFSLHSITIFWLCALFYANGRLNEDINQAAKHAREMVRDSNDDNTFRATIATAPSSFNPFVTEEDYCEGIYQNGIPVFFLANMSRTVYNFELSSIGSVAFFDSNCTSDNFEGCGYDPLACSRFTMTGTFYQEDNDIMQELQMAKFMTCHPAAACWIQVHNFQIWTLNISSIYYIGGYGDRHFIGNIPVEIYLGVI